MSQAVRAPVSEQAGREETVATWGSSRSVGTSSLASSKWRESGDLGDVLGVGEEEDGGSSRGGPGLSDLRLADRLQRAEGGHW